jgi:two-component system, OmpR family, sensor histidine kinase KdpD
VIQFIANRTPKAKQYLLSISFVLIVAAACYFLSGFIGYRVTAFILFVAVSIIATLFDILPVMVAALLSALIWNFFFIPPRFTFHISSAEDIILFLMYFVIASVNAVLTYKIRQLTKIASEEEKKANTVKLYNTLLNSLSHELRTPISTIIGASDNILNDKNKLTEENKRELVSEISQASLRLNRQVENLLNMSRLESGFIQAKKDWCDIHELIHSTTNQLDDVLKDHKVHISIADKLPLFKLDFGLLQQALINLIGNAAIYTPKDSHIKIHAGIRKDKDVEFLILRIEDDGPGLPTGESEKVFEKFYRLKNSKTGGTGLGLSIAKGFVEAHNGTIKLENGSMGGANFIIEIPAETSYINAEK